MPKAVLVVHSQPADPSREDEYNDWYDRVHLPEVCAIPGIVGARRFSHADAAATGSAPAPYLAIYEIDADDPAACITELVARATSGAIHMSDAIQLDPAPLMTLYQQR